MKERGLDQPYIVINKHKTEEDSMIVFFTRLVCLEVVASRGTLFCLPYLLSQTAGTELAWTQSGRTDLKHTAEKVKRHEQANVMCFVMFG